MRVIIIGAVAAFALSGCANMSAPTHGLSQIKTNHERVYETESGTKEFKFEDDFLALTYLPDTVDAGVTFQFLNKSDKVMKIIWDETTYLTPTGESERILHNGVKLVDANQSQPPSIIPPNSNLSDHLVPSSRLSLEDYGWVYAPLCGSKNIMTWDIDDEHCVGKTFGYFITYEIEGKKHHATVKFKYVSRSEKPAKKQEVAGN